MTPEAAASLARARRDLGEARLLAGLKLNRLAARSGYYAAFHAAEALIQERTGRSAKTHRGVHSEFSRLTKGDLGSSRDVWRVLTDAYRYKEMADYSTDPDADISDDATGQVIADASRFVDRIADLLANPLGS
ncbi:HEPN domain-containing protein [Lichenibacterium dinghuense]|uniref:HEPN domain-containing protein n=1 Tax=Lichenibacterium dinghuense TaxID=2895977 RepID=UPI001F1CCFDB|nr:HEPN domain-containing protein [Lichenibacterium sp. 6Y81]